MTTKKRWLSAVIEASKDEIPQMPWARGARRATFIARRKAAELAEQTALSA